MNRSLGYVLVLTILLIFTSAGPAQTTRTLELEVEDVVHLCLAHNLVVRSSESDRKIAEDEIKVQQAIFDPLLYAQYVRSHAEEKLSPSYGLSFGGGTSLGGTGSGSTLTNPYIIEDGKSFNASLQQLLPWGGVVELLALDTRTQEEFVGVLYPGYYTARASANFIQPLLKNFGLSVTLAGIRVARKSTSIAEEDVRRVLMEQLSEALRTYWELLFSLENYKAVETAVKQAEDLRRINQIKYETGVLPRTDVLLAEADVANRKEALVSAGAFIEDVQDQLIKVLNLQGVYPGDILVIKPHGTLSYEQQPVDEQEEIEEALSKRPELLQAALNVDIQELQRTVARNQRLPELNFIAGYGLMGLDEDHEDTFDELGDRTYNNWQLGVEFRYPLFNRRGRYQYRQAIERVKQAETQQQDLMETVMTQLKLAVRRVETSMERIGLSRVAVQFEEQKLRDQTRRYEVGVVTTQDILEYQRDLAQARVRYFRAVADYQQALILLEQAKGTLLEQWGITLPQ